MSTSTPNSTANRILIIDDDQDDQQFLSSAILNVLPGSHVVSLYDGCEALDYMFNKRADGTERQKPDIIFLDLNMPKLDGKIITNILRKQPDLAHIPIVILSTTSNQKEKEQLLAAGANAAYTKPAFDSQLRALVSEVSEKFLSAKNIAHTEISNDLLLVG